MAQWELSYSNGTVNAIISDSTVTSCIFTVANTNFPETVTNGVASLPLVLHPSVATIPVLVTVTAANTQQGTINIGGLGQANVSLQVYVDPSTNTQMVGPSGPGSLAFLRQYYDVASGISQEEQSGDLLTIIGILLDIVTQLAQGKTLSANALNLINDLETNVVSNLPVTAETAAPVPPSGVPQTFSPAYSQYRADTQMASLSVKNFLNAIASIPNLA